MTKINKVDLHGSKGLCDSKWRCAEFLRLGFGGGKNNGTEFLIVL